MAHSFDAIVIGAGLTGCLHAHFLSKLGFKVAVYEQSGEIGGLCKTQNMFGINVHCHGPHVFHTSSELEWAFVNSVCEFDEYFIDVKAVRDGVEYDFPINMNTIRAVHGNDAEKVANDIARRMNRPDTSNLETFAVSTMGHELYEKFVRFYTEKQWGKPCTELPHTILKRIPIHFDDSRNYHADTHSGVPRKGWTHFMERLVEGCDVFLNTKINMGTIMQSEALVVYTGRIDELFGYDMGELEYRGIRHETSILNTPSFQGRGVVNYTGTEPFTRIIEHKFLGNNDGCKHKTIISTEHPDREGMKCYPVETKENNELYKKYRRRLSLLNGGIRIDGRLAKYKYMNMNDVVRDVIAQYSIVNSKEF